MHRGFGSFTTHPGAARDHWTSTFGGHQLLQCRSMLHAVVAVFAASAVATVIIDAASAFRGHRSVSR
jgi:hypothetical protein